MRSTHEVFRTRDGAVIYRGSWEACTRYLRTTNGYFWLMIRQAY